MSGRVLLLPIPCILHQIWRAILSQLHISEHELEKKTKKGVERTHYKYSWARLQKEICEILNRALHAQSKDS